MAFELPPIEPGEAEELCKSSEYFTLLLKKYEHWNLYLNQNQAHFGRAYIWLTSRHLDMHPLYMLTNNELFEFRKILGEYTRALGTMLVHPPELINCEWLGNELDAHRGHGHMHFIPRYSEPVHFDNEVFVDKRFGKRSDYRKFNAAPMVMVKIRDRIRAELNKVSP